MSWSFTNKDSYGVLGRNSPCAFVLHAWCAKMQKKEVFVSCRTFFRTFSVFQLFWKVHSVICRTAVMWWHLGCHPYLVVASAERSQERSSCVNLDFFYALLCACIYRGWNWEAHLKCTWTYSCLACTKKQPMCSCFVAWCTSVAKNVLFQVKNVLKNILFFLAIWDSPREVVVQLCLSCNWLWWCDIILIHL